jgi:hypothetical protein
MIIRYFRRFVAVFGSLLIGWAGTAVLQAQTGQAQIGQAQTGRGQNAKHTVQESSASNHDDDGDHIEQRNQWFYRGRIVAGKQSAELRRRAYLAKLRMRAQHAAALAAAASTTAASDKVQQNGSPQPSSGSWTPLGPAPLASDATGNGTQSYNQVAGRATAVAIDPADPTGNTVYIGGAQAGVWQSTNAANSTANNVTWMPLTDDQATLSIGALAIQPGNTNPAQSVILAATGEADDSGDSYFGLGILRSADAGNSWNLVSTANSGSLSFGGLGGTRMAFSSATGQINTVVAAMATSSEGVVAGAVTSNTTPGLYTSLDAGQTWNYDALTDPGGATDATSATSVVYNASAGLFFAAVRYHGFYSSPDGVNWTRLATQPGSALTTTACPPQSTSNSQSCPLFRAEMTVVPGRNEMYAWWVYFSPPDTVADGGIWQSLNGGASWNPISDAGVTNCGDVVGCGVEQAYFDLELQAVPNMAGTDLYAGAVNLYKCSINPENPACTSPGFMNLTHVYGCDPIAAPAHVHPDQHWLAYTIPAAGNALMYFANDGGIYRALNAYAGLTTGSCSGANQFDDLNQNLGSMTQFVSFSQHPTDPNTLLGGTQDNGSPATAQATTNPAWGNVLGGDGGYNAIDPNVTSNFYASNPDLPPGGLGIQLCPDGVNCVESDFSFVITSSTVGGDDGAFYFPYILDPQSMSALLVGTCRVWRGPRTGGAYTVLSPNFDTLSSGTCSGSEVNLVSAIAAGGPMDNNGSKVIYAATSGLGPINGPASSPVGGNVWVTANATAGANSFSNVTSNGPAGSINPNQFPVASVAIDSSDLTGATAYVTVMGFTSPPGSTSATGHVWQTTNAGATWTDFTGNLPDAPVNAVVIDSTNANVYVGTDVGVFVSSTASANWTEVGPAPGPSQSGFLPNVAVTALGLFNSGGQELLRASTYGRGIWQFNLNTTPSYQLTISNSPLTAFSGQLPGFTGTANAVNEYSNSVTLSCVAGATQPPSTCTVPQSPLTPASNTPFSVAVGGAPGTYNFNIQGVGSDPSQITQQVPVTLNLVSFALSTPTPSTITVPVGTTSGPVNFQVTAAASFNQSVSLTCTPAIPNATCSLLPGTTVSPTSSNPVNMSATVTVPAGTAPNHYTVTIQATSAGVPAPITATFTVTVASNPTFTISELSAFPEVNVGSTGTSGPISVASQDGFSGTVAVSCASTFGTGSCSVSPTSVSSFPSTSMLTINGTSFAAGSYSLSVTGTSGSVSQSVAVPFNVGDYAISGASTLNVAQGGQGKATLTISPLFFYSGKINATCNASALPGAQCTLPSNPISVPSSGTTPLIVTLNVPTNANQGSYPIQITTQDTTGTPSHSFSIMVNVTQDFLVISATPSQTVDAGQTTGAYNLSVQPVGSAFSAAVTLSCTGLPAGAQCLFVPAGPIAPGNSAVDVVMSISTSSGSNFRSPSLRAPNQRDPKLQSPNLRRNLRAANLHDSDMRRSGLRLAIFAGANLLWPGMLLVWVRGRKRCLPSIAARRSALLSKLLRATLLPLLLSMLSLLLIFLLSCGGVSSGGGGGGNCSSTPAAPSGLAATWSNSGTQLNWTPPNVGPICNLTYPIYQNGSSTPIANVTTATYGIEPLPPGAYTFTVAASDAAGTSGPSAPVGLYTVTITGTSPGTPPDAGQSTQVILVVN